MKGFVKLLCSLLSNKDIDNYDSYILNDRLEIRLNDKEKELWKAYAGFKNKSISEVVRSAVNKDIDILIKTIQNK